MEACPDGCCFAPRWSHIEYTRYYEVIFVLFVLTGPALVVGLKERKGESLLYAVIDLFALGYFIVYLMGTFVLQEVCTEQGHDNLSPQQAQQAYGNDHACQQNRTASPL
jgi:bacteriorhodopsin